VANFDTGADWKLTTQLQHFSAQQAARESSRVIGECMRSNVGLRMCLSSSEMLI
jgi:hypothetical protein